MRKLVIQPDDRILVVAPHPDDETIGCGALIAMYGHQIDILLITDGYQGHGEGISDAECIEIRNREIEKVGEMAGIANLYCLLLPDGDSYAHRRVITEFDYSPYNKVFLPNRLEEHVDHRVANTTVRKALRKQNVNSDVYEYEVWTTLLFPNVFLDYSDSAMQKKELLSCYESQLAMRDYHAMSDGLGLYRGVSCRCRYAEAYEHVEKKHALKSLFFRLPISVQNVLFKS